MRAALVLLTLMLAACNGQTGTTTSSQTTVTTTRAASTSSIATSIPGVGCPQTTEFVDEGRVARLDQPESDSVIVGLISWQVEDGCEVFRIDFHTAEGAPATTPPSVVIEYLDTRQVLRVHMAAEQTVIIDQIVETDLVDRLFVVRELDGGMFLDFHLREPVQTRAQVTNSPARVTVMFQPGLLAFEAEALISDSIVLTEPPNGAERATNLEVSGYARTFEANVLIIATSGDEVVAETNTTAADSVDTWGEFTTRIDVPVGETSIFVGEEDAADGSLSGVTVAIRNR